MILVRRLQGTRRYRHFKCIPKIPLHSPELQGTQRTVHVCLVSFRAWLHVLTTCDAVVWDAQKLPVLRPTSLAAAAEEEATVGGPAAVEFCVFSAKGGVAASSASGGGHVPSANAPLYCNTVDMSQQTINTRVQCPQLGIALLPSVMPTRQLH